MTYISENCSVLKHLLNCFQQGYIKDLMFTYSDRSTSTTNTTNFSKYNTAWLLRMITKVVEYEMIAYNKMVMFFVVGQLLLKCRKM